MKTQEREPRQNSKASTILWHSSKTVFCRWDGNIQEYPFAEWNCDKFAGKANSHEMVAILWHGKLIIFYDWNGDGSTKPGHCAWNSYSLAFKTVFAEGNGNDNDSV
jgi:hypothetical protein